MQNRELRTIGVLGKVGNSRLGQEVGRIVAVSPVLHDLATGDMEHGDGFVLHPLADRSELLELSQVDAPHSDAGRPIFPFVQTALGVGRMPIIRCTYRRLITSQMVDRINEKFIGECAAAFAGEVGPPSSPARQLLTVERSRRERRYAAAKVLWLS